MSIKLVTFDLDDTLWDSGLVIRAAEVKMRKWLADNAPAMAGAFDSSRQREIRERVMADDPKIIHNLSELRRRVMEEAMLACGYSREESTELSQRAFSVFFEARQKVELFDGTLPMLASLQRNFVLGALSNGNANLQRVGLDHLFSFHFSSESIGVGKPAPDMFNAALEWAQASPSETVHVGDHPEHDMLGAARLGIHTIWFNTREFDPLDEVTPSRVAASLHEIPQLIESIGDSL